MGKSAFLIISVVVVGLLAGALFFSKYNSSDKNILKISGRVEVDEIDLAFKLSGRIDNFPVEEGDFLKKGSFVASISADDIKAKVDGIKKDIDSSIVVKTLKDNQLKILKSKLEQLKDRKNLLSTEIKNAILLSKQSVKNAESLLNIRRSDYEKVKINHQNVEKDYKRLSNLLKENAVSQKRFDEIYSLYNITSQELKNAEDSILIAEGDVANAKNNLKVAESKSMEIAILDKEIASMEIQLDSAEKDKILAENNTIKLHKLLEEAETYLEDTRISTFTDLIVLKKYAQNSEVVSAGTPILSAYEVNKKYFRGFLPETELPKVKIGMEGSISLDGYDELLKAEITYISDRSEFTPKEVQTQKERVKQVFLIKAKIIDPKGVTKPGMPADLTLNIQ